jgi:type IV pilus assembly protein PilW
MTFKNAMTTNRAAARSMLGMGLVEILVAMLIGLIGMVIITQVYSVSEERKRTTTGVGDAQITGNISMFTLERELRLAGFGMVSAAANMLGCAAAAYDSSRASLTALPTMAPVRITVGASGAPDQVTIIYGNSETAAEGSAFRAAATSTTFPLKNAAGFQVGDIVVASEGGNCAMAEITGFTASALNDAELGAAAAYSYTDIHGTTVNVTATHNPPPGGLLGYTSSAMLFSLGRNPVIRTYLVADDKLKTQTLFPYDATQDVGNDGWSDAEIADGVVQLKAQYGKDTDGDRIVDAWNTTTPSTTADWLQVRAVKVALVARSGQYEKTAVTADCVAAGNPANSVYWSGGCFTLTNPADGTDWHNYRYRVYETVVPLRNMIWSNDP